MINVLEIDGVILEFDSHRVLQDVYLKCETGKKVGLLGKNGSGKSSLFKIIFGELKVNYQSVRINGIPVNDSSGRIKLLSQHNFLPKFLTIEKALRDFKTNFDDLVLIFPEFRSHYKTKLKNLSSGQRRIIEVFVILTSDAEFCLLDEPFSQVMPIHINSIKKLIKREEKDKGIILTDHMFRDIVDLCDSIYVISNGKTYLTSSIDDLEKLEYARIT